MRRIPEYDLSGGGRFLKFHFVYTNHSTNHWFFCVLSALSENRRENIVHSLPGCSEALHTSCPSHSSETSCSQCVETQTSVWWRIFELRYIYLITNNKCTIFRQLIITTCKRKSMNKSWGPYWILSNEENSLIWFE